MPSTTTSATSAPTLNDSSVETVYLSKCMELKRKVTEIEQHNELMSLSIHRTKHELKRLKLERIVLQDRLENGNPLLALVGPELDVNENEDDDDLDDDKDDNEENGAGDDEDDELDDEEGEDGDDEQGQSGTSRKKGHVLIAKKPAGSGAAGGEDGRQGPAGKKKTPRNPNLPRRPRNAYLIFCEREKEKYKKEMEDPKLAAQESTTDLTKIMADRWHKLPEETKKEFALLSRNDTERYAREILEVFKSRKPVNESEESELKRAKKTMERAENRIKRQEGESEIEVKDEEQDGEDHEEEEEEEDNDDEEEEEEDGDAHAGADGDVDDREGGADAEEHDGEEHEGEEQDDDDGEDEDAENAEEDEGDMDLDEPESELPEPASELPEPTSELPDIIDSEQPDLDSEMPILDSEAPEAAAAAAAAADLESDLPEHDE